MDVRDRADRRCSRRSSYADFIAVCQVNAIIDISFQTNAIDIYVGYILSNKTILQSIASQLYTVSLDCRIISKYQRFI
mgnify:CR=1 FL=1